MAGEQKVFRGKEIAEEMTRLSNAEIKLTERVELLEGLLQLWYVVHNTDYLELNKLTAKAIKNKLDELE